MKLLPLGMALALLGTGAVFAATPSTRSVLPRNPSNLASITLVCGSKASSSLIARIDIVLDEQQPHEGMDRPNAVNVP